MSAATNAASPATASTSSRIADTILRPTVRGIRTKNGAFFGAAVADSLSRVTGGVNLGGFAVSPEGVRDETSDKQHARKRPRTGCETDTGAKSKWHSAIVGQAAGFAVAHFRWQY